MLGAVLREILIHANYLTLYVFFERGRKEQNTIYGREKPKVTDMQYVVLPYNLNMG